MVGSVAVLKEPIAHTVRSVPCLRLVYMPEATCIGELFETPSQRNPQEVPLAKLYRVEGHKEDNGVYAIPFRAAEDLSVYEYFLAQARKITNHLPEGRGSFPTFGAEECRYTPSSDNILRDMYPYGQFPSTEVLNPEKKKDLRQTIITGIRRNHRPTTILKFER